MSKRVLYTLGLVLLAILVTVTVWLGATSLGAGGRVRHPPKPRAKFGPEALHRARRGRDVHPGKGRQPAADLRPSTAQEIGDPEDHHRGSGHPGWHPRTPFAAPHRPRAYAE